MKRTITRQTAVKMCFALFFFIGLFLFAPAALQAQTKLDESVPAGPYVSQQEAIERIEQHIEIIKPQLEFMNPHTQEYRNQVARVDFYSGILEQLYKGTNVQESIVYGLTVLSSDQHSTVSKSKRLEYKSEAVEILQP